MSRAQQGEQSRETTSGSTRIAREGRRSITGGLSAEKAHLDRRSWGGAGCPDAATPLPLIPSLRTTVSPPTPEISRLPSNTLFQHLTIPSCLCLGLPEDCRSHLIITIHISEGERGRGWMKMVRIEGETREFFSRCEDVSLSLKSSGGNHRLG